MTAPGPELFSFADPEKLAGALAEAVAGFLRDGLAARKQAALVVSGGTTPAPLFRRLRQMELPWPRVWITLADERWVEPEHEASNERLVRTLLLRDQAGAATFVPLKNRGKTARDGEEECNRALARMPRPFDLVVLGMGADGHTASFFPGAQRLAEALAPDPGRDCLAITAAQGQYERITLTLPTLLNARRIILHLTGRDKEQVLRQALSAGPVPEMPVRAILRQQHTPVHIYWAP